MLNTSRQIGSVIGTAVIGAVLQNRLASTLADQARVYSVQLPEPLRAPFVNAFSHAADHGLQVVPGQNGGAMLANVPPDAAASLNRIAHDAFVTGFIDAARPTLWVSVAVLAVAVLSCLAARARPDAVQVAAPAAAARTSESATPAVS